MIAAMTSGREAPSAFQDSVSRHFGSTGSCYECRRQRMSANAPSFWSSMHRFALYCQPALRPEDCLRWMRFYSSRHQQQHSRTALNLQRQEVSSRGTTKHTSKLRLNRRFKSGLRHPCQLISSRPERTACQHRFLHSDAESSPRPEACAPKVYLSPPMRIQLLHYRRKDLATGDQQVSLSRNSTASRLPTTRWLFANFSEGKVPIRIFEKKSVGGD